MLVSQHGVAQLVWTGPQLSVDSGNMVSVSLTVSSYQDLIAAQGTIEFDPLVLDYSHVDDFALSSMNGNSFGETLVDNGSLTFSWSELDLVGKDLADNDTIFTMHFDVIGNPGDSTLIELVNSPTTVEFVDGSFNPVPYSSTSGIVRVNDEAHVGINEVSVLNNWKLYPNPAFSEIEVSGLPHDGLLEAKWYTLSGQLLMTEWIWVSGSRGKLLLTNMNQGLYRLYLGNERCGFENHLIRKL